MFDKITVEPIQNKDAELIIKRNHYMKTFPKGVKVSFGLFFEGKVLGVCVFGYSSATHQKANKLGFNLVQSDYLEMQRLWISDKLGHNTESFFLGKIMGILKGTVKLIITHAGGCKHDCGIVYQASAWVYLGKEPCSDFYLTAKGEYKNIVSAMRFCRINSKGKTKQEIGFELFGSGEIINSFRYNYIYPLDKGIRRKLNKIALPFPKDSLHFRRDQQWV